MPFYDYRCEDCGQEFETFRPIDRRDQAECPECKSAKTKRLLRALGLFSGGRRGSGGGSCGPVRSGFG